MNLLQPSNNCFELWRYYRSLTLGRPINITQAYNSVYPWIDYCGVYFNRKYEPYLYLLFNNINVPESMTSIIKLLESAYNKIINGTTVCGEIAMAKPSDNTKQKSLIRIYKDITIYNKVNIDISKLKSTVYTNVYNLGADYCISDKQCLKNSYKMPVIISPSTYIDDKSLVYWPNIWVWED